MLDKIASEVRQAATEGHKIAMFHLMVLKHAHELSDVDPLKFCREIDVPESFATEFRKMLALRRLMREQQIGLTFL
jgi:hypothetical protein